MNYIKVLDEIFSQFTGPKFSLKAWNGNVYTYGSGKTITFTLHIKDVKTAKRLLSQGALGFGESYMDGSLTIQGDIDAYMRLRHQFKHVQRSASLVKATVHAKMTTPKKRGEQISYHYDLGTDFFKLILDHPTMSYSCGKYFTGKESQAQAQINKLQLVCDWLDIKKGSSVLDLGAGWGGFAEFATNKHKWHVTGYSLSQAQLQYCKQLFKNNKNASLATFKYKDMLHLKDQKQYDAIVMIESIEHVGKQHLATFFKDLYKMLKPGGVLYVQSTGRYKVHRVDPWTLKYVFPGGYLPSIGELFTAAGEAGFSINNYVDDTDDYIKTMSVWIDNLESHKKGIIDMFDEPFYRLWELWMHGARAAFEVQSMSLFRLRFTKPHIPDYAK